MRQTSLKVPGCLAAGLFLFVACIAVPASADPGSGGKPCRPLTCQKLDVECGEWDDGCGGTSDCGGCEDGMECDAGECTDESGEWALPNCDRVMGTGAVKFTMDDGVTLADGPPLNGSIYTYGLAALDRPDTLLATTMNSTGNTVLRSEDAGCSWDTVDHLDNYNLLRLTAAPDGVAYGWTNSRDIIFRIEGDEIEERITPENIYGIAVDPLDADHLRVGGLDCQIWESFDGGDNFAPVGSPAGTGESIFFTVAFHPRDWDQALCGGKGAWGTTDAGESWTPIATFDNDDLDFVYVLRYAPSDPRQVWARVTLDTLDTSERLIMYSDDGGASFLPAVAQGDEALDQFGITRTVILTNVPTMAVHPELPEVLYFVFGTAFQDYGTDLFRYDALLDELGVAHIDDLDGIDAIEFSPADPALIYLGLESADY